MWTCSLPVISCYHSVGKRPSWAGGDQRGAERPSASIAPARPARSCGSPARLPAARAVLQGTWIRKREVRVVPGREGPGLGKVRNVGRADRRGTDSWGDPSLPSVAVSGAGGHPRPELAPALAPRSPPPRPRSAPDPAPPLAPSLGAATSALSARAVMEKEVAAEVGVRLALFAAFL